MLINPSSAEILSKPQSQPQQEEEKAVVSMNHYLRGEIAATEAYEKALNELDGELNCIRLSAFLSDHHEATLYWRDQVIAEYDEPQDNSGSWGAFVKSVVNAAKLLGPKATLKALKEGEEHGLEQYEKATRQDHLSVTLKYHIRNILIPNQKRHIAELAGMIENS